VKKISDVLEAKGKNGSVVWSSKPSAIVYDALCLMAEKGIGALLVMDKKELVGIMSERDYARKVVLAGRSSVNTPVSEIMTSEVCTVTADQDVESSMQLMMERHIRHLPVMDGTKVVGVVSLGDLAHMVIEDQRSTIKELQGTS